MNRGAELLKQTRLSHTAVAQRFGVSQALVGRWFKGSTRPGPAFRKLIAADLQIPDDAWDDKSISVADILHDLTPRVVPNVRVAKVEEAPTSAKADIFAHTDDLRIFLETAKKEGSVADYNRAAANYTKALELKARVNNEMGAVDEARFLESARWKRIEAALTAALTPYPQAMRAVGEALKRLEEAA